MNENVFVTLATIGKLVSEYAYPVEDECLKNLDYESHRRGKNWIAYVRPNRAAPGGLDREFWKHGSGAWFLMPRKAKPGDIIEMGGDYYTARGNARRDRRYVMVVRVDDGVIIGASMGSTAPSAARVAKERAECGIEVAT